MSALVLFLAAVAITVVFVRGSIFEPVRTRGPTLWQELAKCPLCAGFWIGAGWRLFWTRAQPLELSALLERVLELVAFGAMTGLVALFASLLVALLDKHS